MSDFAIRRNFLKSLALISAVTLSGHAVGIAYADDRDKKAKALEKLIDERDRKIEKAGVEYERDVREAAGKSGKLETAEAKYEEKVRKARRKFREKKAKLEN